MSKYSLFSGPERGKIEEAVDALVQEFATKYGGLKEAWPHSGLGDTAADERMVSRLYGVVHFNDWEWPEKLEKRYAKGSTGVPLTGEGNAALEEA